MAARTFIISATVPNCGAAALHVGDSAAGTVVVMESFSYRPISEQVSVSRRGRIVGAVLAALVLVFALVFVDAGVLELSPGPVQAVEISGDPVRDEYEADSWLFTTVRADPLSWFGYLRARARGGDVVDRVTLTSGSDQIAAQQMEESKALAWSAAERLVDGAVSGEAIGARVSVVTSGSAAEVAGLAAGDVIVAVGNDPVLSADEARDALTARSDTFEVALDRNGDRRTVVVDGSGGKVGLGLVDAVKVGPAPVAVETGSVKGPSAGLIFSLAFIDAKSERGTLADGRVVAGTGEVDVAGAVKPVGGVRYKVVAAEQAGADVFFVPRVELAEAQRAADEMGVVPVDSVGDALRWLCDHGGDVPACKND